MSRDTNPQTLLLLTRKISDAFLIGGWVPGMGIGAGFGSIVSRSAQPARRSVLDQTNRWSAGDLVNAMTEAEIVPLLRRRPGIHPGMCEGYGDCL
jgi:hypothetical protein